jgi:hypothetical protein
MSKLIMNTCKLIVITILTFAINLTITNFANAQNIKIQPWTLTNHIDPIDDTNTIIAYKIYKNGYKYTSFNKR